MDVTLLTPMPTSRIEDLKEFCTKHRDLILNNNFDELYKQTAMDPVIRNRDLTYLFMKTGIDPLKYMTYVPAMMFQGLGGFSNLTLPKNIEQITLYFLILKRLVLSPLTQKNIKTCL